ncbi:hypothetical protein C8R45DRAFT_1089723 [Mycena sanguinolenta]|nr:hypothetical protein C8R45DRAFT_1089723 [Mycena sanguinolenta]
MVHALRTAKPYATRLHANTVNNQLHDFATQNPVPFNPVDALVVTFAGLSFAKSRLNKDDNEFVDVGEPAAKKTKAGWTGPSSPENCPQFFGSPSSFLRRYSAYQLTLSLTSASSARSEKATTPTSPSQNDSGLGVPVPSSGSSEDCRRAGSHSLVPPPAAREPVTVTVTELVVTVRPVLNLAQQRELADWNLRPHTPRRGPVDILITEVVAVVRPVLTPGQQRSLDYWNARCLKARSDLSIHAPSSSCSPAVDPTSSVRSSSSALKDISNSGARGRSRSGTIAGGPGSSKKGRGRVENVVDRTSRTSRSRGFIYFKSPILFYGDVPGPMPGYEDDARSRLEHKLLLVRISTLLSHVPGADLVEKYRKCFIYASAALLIGDVPGSPVRLGMRTVLPACFRSDAFLSPPSFGRDRCLMGINCLMGACRVLDIPAYEDEVACSTMTVYVDLLLDVAFPNPPLPSAGPPPPPRTPASGTTTITTVVTLLKAFAPRLPVCVHVYPPPVSTGYTHYYPITHL